MSYIHFKTVYNNNFDKLTFDGVNLPLSQVKKMIFEKSSFKVNKQIDFDLEITNADTNEVYRSENDSIVKNTRLLVKRVVRNSAAPLRAQPPKITTQSAYQNAQTAATATNTTAASAAASFSTTSAVTISSNLTNNPHQPVTPSIVVSNSLNPVIQQKNVITSAKPTLTQPPPSSVNIIETAKSLTTFNNASVISQDLSGISENLAKPSVASTDIKTVTQSNTSSNSKTTIESLPKAVYDSLAPLNLPSKPIFYTDEKQTIENKKNQIESSILTETSSNSSDAIPSLSKSVEITTPATQVEKEKSEISRLDEKAKLESILFNSMSQSSGSYQQKGIHHGGISDNTSLSLNNLTKTNRYGLNLGSVVNSGNVLGANVNAWNANANNLHLIHHQLPNQFNMPRLHPGYLCSICRKPGHAKSFCPEAGTIKHTDFIKTPKGIPRSFQLPADPGHKFAMRGPDGGFVVSEIEHKAAQIIKKDKQIFLDDDEPTQNKKSDDDETQSENENIQNLNSKMIPSELKCPYGDHIIRDAVLVPCCGHFVCCDECIRQKISNDGIEEIECPHEGCDIGSLGSITPFHEIRKKVSEYLSSLKSTSSRSNSNQAQTQNDPFFDLILNDVKSGSDALTQNSKSPLQDSKISSSEALLSLNAANNSSVNQTKQMEAILTTKALDVLSESTISLDSKNISSFQKQLSQSSSLEPISKPISTTPVLTTNNQIDSDVSLNKINQPIAFNTNPTPTSNYNVNQQASQFFPINKPQPFNSNINQQNFMMQQQQQQQANMNFSRNNQINSNQGYIDNYQNQKQMQNNRMQTNVNTNMFNMNNSGSFMNSQQRLPINQHQMPLQTQSNPMFNQFDQHNIPFNAGNNLNQFQSHSFHQQHANVNINQSVFPQSQPTNVMNPPHMQLQPNSYDSFNNINMGITGQQHTSGLLPSTVASIHNQNSSAIVGQHIAPNMSTGLSNVMFDSSQQASQYMPKNDLLLNNLSLKPDPISTSIINAPLTSSISNLPIFPIDGIMTEAQFYQYQERLRKERELKEMARAEQGQYSSYKSYAKPDQRLTKRRYSRSRSRSYSRTRSSYSRSRSRSFSRSPSRGRTRNSPIKDKPIRKRSYTRSRSRSLYSSRSNSPSYKKTNTNERQQSNKYYSNYQRNRTKSRSPTKKSYTQTYQKTNQSSYQQVGMADNYKPSMKSYNSQPNQHYNRNHRQNYVSSNQRSRSRSKGKSTSASLLSRISGKSSTIPSNIIECNLLIDKGQSHRSPYNRSRSRSPAKKIPYSQETFHNLKQSNIKQSNQDDSQSSELPSTMSLTKANRSDEKLEEKIKDIQQNEMNNVNVNEVKTNDHESNKPCLPESAGKQKSEKKEKKKKHHKRDKSDKKEKSKKEDKHKKIAHKEENPEKNLEKVEQQQLIAEASTSTAIVNENLNPPVEKLKKHSSNTKIKLSRSNGEKRRSSTNFLVSLTDNNELRHRNVKLPEINDEKNLIDSNVEEIEKVSKKKKTNNPIEPSTIITTTTLNEILNKETDKEKSNSSKIEKSKEKKSKHKSKKKKHKHKHRSSSPSKTSSSKSSSKLKT